MDPPDWFDCIDQAEGVPGTQLLTMSSPTSRPTTPAPVTAAPTRSPLPGDSRRLRVVLELDDWPWQTGWTLSSISGDGEGEVIYDMPIGRYTNADAGKTLRYDVLVESENFYNLTIYDLNGNGFAGTLTVIEDSVPSDEKTLVKEPGFTGVSGTSVSHGFYVGTFPEQFLTLDFKFDYFAHEVAYEIKNDKDDIIFALAWYGTFDAGAISETMIIPIYGPERGDQDYSLRLWDGGNDGICCTWGEGGFQLFVGDPGQNNLLRSGGNYGQGEEFKFVVEGDPPPTSSPTRNPSTPPTSSPTRTPSMPPTQDPSYSPTPKAPTQDPSTRPTYSPLSLPFPFEPFAHTETIIPKPSPVASSMDAGPTPAESGNEEYYSSSFVAVRTAAPSTAPANETIDKRESIIVAASNSDASSAASSTCRHVSLNFSALCMAFASIATWASSF